MGERRKTGSIPLALLVAASCAGAWAAAAATIVGSRHDLSTTGVDPYSNQTCAFCHTPHGANRILDAPLWNRFVSTTKVFTVYASATMDTVPGQPTSGVSDLCLGCHDGTIGMIVVNGITGSDKHDLVNAPGPGGTPDLTSYPDCRKCHGEMYGDPPAVWQGLDLSDDHPIAMTFPASSLDPGFHLPPDIVRGWPDLPLYSGKVECATCHDVHDPGITPFLRTSNAGSALCLRCHVK